MRIGKLGQRLVYLRKDLSQRLGEDLSINDVAQKMGVKQHTLARLEGGRGAMDSLVIVLRYYRMQGYNTDWILEDENENTPMVVPSPKAMLSVVATLNKLRECVIEYSGELENQLKTIGLDPQRSQSFSKVADTDLMLPPGL
ncbi:hypothetical protein ACFQ4C_29860 [Larkinella insperata]|uniref:XRE family transcriptional regulator n=1 Tax=Larkinella insperata TaxID=332158 RepID=A0ABW3QFL4_9BACT